MPTNVTPYWNSVAKLEAQLTPQRVNGGVDCFFITSLQTPLNEQQGVRSGVVKECPRRLAAEMIVQNVFRLATEVEVQQYEEQGKQNAEQLNISEARRKQAGAVLRVDREELLRLGSLVEPEKK
jgi:hypothetical protein